MTLLRKNDKILKKGTNKTCTGNDLNILALRIPLHIPEKMSAFGTLTKMLKVVEFPAKMTREATEEASVNLSERVERRKNR